MRIIVSVFLLSMVLRPGMIEKFFIFHYLFGFIFSGDNISQCNVYCLRTFCIDMSGLDLRSSSCVYLQCWSYGWAHHAQLVFQLRSAVRASVMPHAISILYLCHHFLHGYCLGTESFP